MADIDIDPFGGHESRPEEPTDEHIPLDLATPGRSTWEPECEQETSFRGRESQRTKLMKDYVKDLYKKISENIGETPEEFHYQTRRWGTILQRQEKALNNQRCAEIGWNVSGYIG